MKLVVSSSKSLRSLFSVCIVFVLGIVSYSSSSDVALTALTSPSNGTLIDGDLSTLNELFDSPASVKPYLELDHTFNVYICKKIQDVSDEGESNQPITDQFSSVIISGLVKHPRINIGK